MKISLNILKEFINIDLLPNDLGDLFTKIGFEVEDIIDYNQIYSGFVTGLVTERIKHPNSDKLSICKVDVGNQVLSVVCGASNVKENIKIILGLEGAVVPSNGIKLEKRTIRGEESNGMICSESELNIGTDSSGIMILPDETQIGLPISDLFSLNDVIFDLSVTANRADGNSHYGIAKDLSAFLNVNLKNLTPKIIQNGENIQNLINIEIKDFENCKRYFALIIKNIEKLESPNWLKSRLKLLGINPINLPVDATNYVMMEYGNPLHAFDLDKIVGNKIIIDKSINYNFKTLDGKEKELDDTILTINDASKPIAIAGIMGGFNSQIDENTKNILMEVAYFNPTHIRKNSKKLSIQSDSSYRFERGVDLFNIPNAAFRCAEIIQQNSNCIISNGFIDEVVEFPPKKIIKVRFNRIRKIIGINESNEEILNYIKKFNWELNGFEEYFEIVSPQNRNDLNEEIDIVEEFARIYNYDKIKIDYNSSHSIDSKVGNVNLNENPIKNKISNYLISNGFNETILQNQTTEELASIFNQKIVKIENPLNKELNTMKTNNLIPLLKSVQRNFNFRNQNLKLFTIGKIFLKDNDNRFIDGINEIEQLTLLMTGSKFPNQWGENHKNIDYYDCKGFAEDLLTYLRINDFKFVESQNLNFLSSESKSLLKEDREIGYIGKISKSILKHFDLEADIFVINLNLDYFKNKNNSINTFKKVSAFPTSERDLAFLFDKNVKYEDIINEVNSSAGEILQKSYIFDYFIPKNENNEKSIAIKLIFGSNLRTLTDIEINKSIENIIINVNKKLNGRIRV